MELNYYSFPMIICLFMFTPYMKEKYGMKVEFTKKNNKVAKIEYKGLKGFKKFKPAQMRDLKKLITKYADQITDDWVDFYVQGAKIKTRVITKKL